MSFSVSQFTKLVATTDVSRGSPPCPTRGIRSAFSRSTTANGCLSFPPSSSARGSSMSEAQDSQASCAVIMQNNILSLVSSIHVVLWEVSWCSLPFRNLLNFVNPGLKQDNFYSQFVWPINKGQHINSTDYHVNEMRKAYDSLFRYLDGCVHRKYYRSLVEYLPKKFEYVIKIQMSDLQVQLYNKYWSVFGDTQSLFKLQKNLAKIWTHPLLVKEKIEGISSNVKLWWNEIIKPYHKDTKDIGGKLTVLFEIIRKALEIDDKVIIFTQSLPVLDIIENLLLNQHRPHDPFNSFNTWIKELDYDRMDGGPNIHACTDIQARFNSVDNLRLRLLLVSTLADGKRVNLVSANRVIIFDVPWNHVPSFETQVILGSYRLAQKKTVYVYRLVSHGTLEETMYNRSVFQRVVDGHQITRHFTEEELRSHNQYALSDKKRETISPQDKVLADMVKKFPQLIYGYLNYDCLLDCAEISPIEKPRSSAMQYEICTHKKYDIEGTNFIETGGSNRQIRIVYRCTHCGHKWNDLY